MDGTVISDAVNLSARIENLTKNYKSPLLISHHTYAALINPEAYAIRMIDLVTVKGKEELVTVYEVFDADPEPIKEAKLLTMELFTNAISAYNNKEFEQAQSLFRQCLAKNPDDNVCQIYLNRCEAEAG
jgi:Adenylate and Guanylate cyclase catalytic domain.